MGDLLPWAIALSIYPLAVLFIALTGPHSEAERRANAEDRAQTAAAKAHLISPGVEQ